STTEAVSSEPTTWTVSTFFFKQRLGTEATAQRLGSRKIRGLPCEKPRIPRLFHLGRLIVIQVRIRG
ncbi:MAG: hypothetical protein LRY35_00510, partial [Clostridiales bacterium]|nr:hypothetical protein [Clostridiales bacterium]